MTKNSDSQDEYLAKIRNVCNGSAEDLELYEAIANFCRQTNDRKRRLAFVPLFKKIEKLRGLEKVSNSSEYYHDYQDILQETWEEFYKKFPAEFEPAGQSLKGSLVTWINEKLRLRYKVIDLYPKYRDDNKGNKPLTPKQRFNQIIRSKPKSLDAPNSTNDFDNDLTIGDFLESEDPGPLEEAIGEEQKQNINMFLEIAKDSKYHMRSCPECTFQAVAQRHFFEEPPKTWKQVALEFGVNYNSLRAFWLRTCEKISQELSPEL
ncbi:MAG: hypothetical protein MK289_22805 [Trichodesmium sp. ALOHA_ZT_67]|nr:hypothetical protein [Trichodesmium sp. ALOHA_ZT_67]MCL2930607.1 hypothetical protein [Trichodesmium sp. MAG_R01]